MEIQKKRLTIRSLTFWAGITMVLAVSLRLLLFILNWPIANGDEAIMGLMARHILYQGEHPIFFWGQNYMGSLQAYLGAGMMAISGSSILSLRLGTLLIYILFIVCMYLLTRLLYTPGFALFVVILLGLGSDRVMSIPLVANGGYAETMFFAAGIFLMVSWLVLSSSAQKSPVRGKRLLIYSILGVVTGLALWSDQLILSALVMAALLLLIGNWRELRLLPIGLLLTGLVVGSLPLILYNLSAAPGQNSFDVLRHLIFYPTPRTVPLTEQILHVLLISLPLATGMPYTTGNHAVCGTVEPYLHPTGGLANFFPGSNPWLCTGIRGGWSLTILILWSIALLSIVAILWRQKKPAGQESENVRDRQAQMRLYARLMLLGSGALWLLLFTFSSAAQLTPRASCRYLICLILVGPAILWPCWQMLIQWKETQTATPWRSRTKMLVNMLILAITLGVSLLGTIDIFTSLPAANSSYSTINSLIQTLKDLHITRIDADYNTCNLIIFQSQEQITCNVLNEQLKQGLNRNGAYVQSVARAGVQAYVFANNAPQTKMLQSHLRTGSGSYPRPINVNNYIIYPWASLEPA